MGIPSPCVNVCRIDPAEGRCVGCRRTLDQIRAWRAASDAEKRRILDSLPPVGPDEGGLVQDRPGVPGA
jgi:uncharacterized protein